MGTCKIEISFKDKHKMGAKVESFGFMKLISKSSSLTYPKRNPLEIFVDIFLLAVRQNFTKY